MDVVTSGAAYLASSTLEKVLEHRFVAELSTALWLDGISDFEILRSEVDAYGYDIVIEASRIMRHVQLKAMVAGGKRRDVSVNLRLADKPSGCVIWMIYDPAKLQLGPFFWLGAEPGSPLPALGNRAARHARGNAQGVKAERSGHRIVPRRSFTGVEDFTGLTRILFGTPAQPAGIASEASSHFSDQCELLRKHLNRVRASGATVPTSIKGEDLASIIKDLTWENSVEVAHLVDGYELVREVGRGDPFRFAEERLARATASGTWHGGPAELWASLLLEHRRWRVSPIDPPASTVKLLDALCSALAVQLAICPTAAES